MAKEEAAPKNTPSEAKFTGGKGIKEGEALMAPTVQSTTDVTPAEADKSSLPNAMDAKPEDPPVRVAKREGREAEGPAGWGGEAGHADRTDPDGRCRGSHPARPEGVRPCRSSS